ncbi:CLUMA_CG005851, isoform A [Clunio marinus]|uniref:CLUMA_CG005851, isoform A n=1 Tax=Clunio marinus TaxID=568069 RepID=A0A1J1HW23_9DIPT|nr:CLUMA_CG005851, isoform A [Clunio marinus]
MNNSGKLRKFVFTIILISVNYEHTLSEFDNPPSNAERVAAINNQQYQFHHDYDTENGFTIDGDDENLHNALNRGPYFDISASKNVTALVGNTAYLNCRVRNLGNKTVTWIRHRDLHLLTVGKETYTQDQRFQSVHNPHNGDWSLKVLYPQQRDSGVYECQIGTSPPVGYSIVLSVVEPITTIIGGPDMYIDQGSTINLTCIVKHLPEPPPGIYWTHNGEEINYDSPRGGVSVITEKGDITTSYLLIQRARSSDSGKYVCLPSNANSQNINVHVLNGEHPAAIQRAASQLDNKSYLLLLLLSFILTTFSKR